MKDFALEVDALALAGGRALFSACATACAPGHDIPHPIGDPDEDESLPGDDDDEDDDDDEEDEEPLQV